MNPMRWLPRQRWLAALAVLAAAGLLLAFQQVAGGAVLQAELRHAAVLAEHNARWRCNHLPDRDLRKACRHESASAGASTAMAAAGLNDKAVAHAKATTSDSSRRRQSDQDR